MIILILALFVVGTLTTRTLRGTRISALRRLPELLLRGGVIEETDLAEVRRAVHRLLSWRWRGGALGGAVFALPMLVMGSAVSLTLVAVLAGATGGAAAAQWWNDSRTAGRQRVASLQPRTISSLVGWTPVVLLPIVLLVAAGATGLWVARQPANGNWTAHSGHWTCSTNVHFSWSALAVAWFVVTVTVTLAVASSVAVTRRATDHSLPERADLALRAAGIRTALGGALAVAGAFGAYVVDQSMTAISLRWTLLGPHCATDSARRQAATFVLGAVVLGCVAAALLGLVGYFLCPGRVPRAARVHVA